jgi:hypothetical protein
MHGYRDDRTIAHELLFLAANVLGGERRGKQEAGQRGEEKRSKKSADVPVGT